jgi:hypothetical protein
MRPLGQHVDGGAALGPRAARGERQPGSEQREQDPRIHPRDPAVHADGDRSERHDDCERDVSSRAAARRHDRPDEQRDAEDESDVDDVRAERVAERDLGPLLGRRADRDRDLRRRRRERGDRRADHTRRHAQPRRDPDGGPNEQLAADGRAGEPRRERDALEHQSARMSP